LKLGTLLLFVFLRTLKEPFVKSANNAKSMGIQNKLPP